MTIVTARCDARHTYRPAICRAAVPMWPRNRPARRAAQSRKRSPSGSSLRGRDRNPMQERSFTESCSPLDGSERACLTNHVRSGMPRVRFQAQILGRSRLKNETLVCYSRSPPSLHNWWSRL